MNKPKQPTKDKQIASKWIGGGLSGGLAMDKILNWTLGKFVCHHACPSPLPRQFSPLGGQVYSYCHFT